MQLCDIVIKLSAYLVIIAPFLPLLYQFFISVILLYNILFDI